MCGFHYRRVIVTYFFKSIFHHSHSTAYTVLLCADGDGPSLRGTRNLQPRRHRQTREPEENTCIKDMVE